MSKSPMTVTKAPRDASVKANQIEHLKAMLRIRRFEEQCIALAKAGKLPGHYHVYIGQEATAVTACAALRPEDFLFSTWRNHGHLLARGAAPERMMAEILGRASGYAGGKSGTLHLSVRKLGVPSTSALVGGSLPLATGAALACKRRGAGVTVACFGDAGLEEGAFYESMIVAKVWQVPILFICENNSIPPKERKRGQYTSSSLPAARLGDIPLALQVPAESVDGTDVDALTECFDRLVTEVREGSGPRFVEVCCNRWPGNIMTWPELPSGEWQVDWAFGGHPDRADMVAWLQSDPLFRYLNKLVTAGIVDRAQAEAIDTGVKAEMADAAKFALDSPFPAANDAYRHVFAEADARL
jgi:acetoin:2,6-dichlorophenolindophenol oxidoreductase subunit alpha